MQRHWLVTGGLGFIGSAFVRHSLQSQPDLRLTVFDALTYAANPANVAEVAGDPRYRFVEGDIADPAAVAAMLADPVDAVINFAAETHVDRSIVDPAAFLRTNVVGTGVLLDAARRRGVPRYLQVSTDEVYGDVATGASTETDPLRPRSPYAAAKAAGDLLVQSYFSTYGYPVLITRGSNTYGPRQFPEKLIPLFTTNLLAGDTVPVYGDGQQIRDWLHVDDHARGIFHVLVHGTPGEVYNIGGGHPEVNLTIAHRLAALTGRDSAGAIRHVTDRLGHDRRYAIDCAKAHRLGWTPQVDFDAGLAATVAWYRDHPGWWRPVPAATAGALS